MQEVIGGACTAIADCGFAHPFVCELRCDDGDPCTTDIINPDGSCAVAPTECDDRDACTTDTCEPGVGCTHTRPADQCADTNPCTTDTCDPETAACAHRPVRVTWDATHEILECPGADTWSAARNWCAVNGGVLAYPTNQAQRDALAAFAQKPGVSASLWVPFQQAGGDATPWTWVDGGGSGDPAWCAGMPDDAGDTEACGEWYGLSACAGDAACGDAKSFACSIDITIP